MQQQQQAQANQFASQMSEGLNRQFADMRAELERHLAEQTAPQEVVRRKTRAIAEPAVGQYVQEAESTAAQPQLSPQPSQQLHQIGWQLSLTGMLPLEVPQSSGASTASWEMPFLEPTTHYQISTPALENS